CRKEALEIAARLFEQHADRRCRSRKPTPRQQNELKALELLDDFFPPMPLEKPELALSNAEKPDLTDPAGGLANDVAMTCRRLYDPLVSADALVTDAERIEKSVQSCRKETRWSYVGGAPTGALDTIERIARDLFVIFSALRSLATSAQGLVMMPSHQRWAKGRGLASAHDRAKALAERQVSAIKSRLSSAFAAGTTDVTVAAKAAEKRSYTWPPFDICLLVECPGLVEYFQWFGEKLDALKSEADKLPSLTTLPVIAGRVFVQCAVRVYGFGALPEPDFARLWTSDITLPFFTSAAAEAFDEVTSNIVLVYAAAQLLGERSLLPVENDFLTAQRDKA